jgi:hypothetical protein
MSLLRCGSQRDISGNRALELWKLKRLGTRHTGIRSAMDSSTPESEVKSLEKTGIPNHRITAITVPKPAPICSNRVSKSNKNKQLKPINNLTLLTHVQR